MAKIRLPSSLTMGDAKSSGPLVNCTGLAVPASHEDFSASAHTLFRPSRELSNRKYLPSGVQVPQHSRGLLFHPGSRGLKPFPLRATSQIELEPFLGSTMKKRSLPPSGEKRRS